MTSSPKITLTYIKYAGHTSINLEKLQTFKIDSDPRCLTVPFSPNSRIGYLFNPFLLFVRVNRDWGDYGNLFWCCCSLSLRTHKISKKTNIREIDYQGGLHIENDITSSLMAPFLVMRRCAYSHVY